MAKIPLPQPISVTAPFDMGAPPAELPQGSSNLPTFDNLPPVETREVDIMQAPNAEWRLQIAQLSEDQQKLIYAWWPRAWNRQSKYLDKNPFILSLPALLMHIEAAAEDESRAHRGHKKQEREARASSYIAWTNECTSRLQWIEGKKQEWDRRVKEAKAARAKWDKYVEEAREEYKAAKLTPVPARPKE